MKTGFKNIACMMVLAAAVVLNVACQKNDDNNNTASTPPPYYNQYGYNQYPYGNGTWATTPQPCNYTGYGYQGSYNCNQYQGYYQNWGAQYPQMNWYYGSWYWPTQIQPQTGYCGCPTGYRPTFSQYYGISCAPNAYFNNWTVTWININAYWGAPQNSWGLSTPQTYYNGSNPGCGQVAQGCDVRMNNCSGGYTCRPVAGGSTIGLCAL